MNTQVDMYKSFCFEGKRKAKCNSEVEEFTECPI